MAKEIERKFLIGVEETNKILNRMSGKCRYITQGYLSYSDDRAVRVRLVEVPASFGIASFGYLTVKIKSDTKSISTDEFEYVIPVDDAKQMLQSCKSIIKKTRYLVEVNGVFCELDVFAGGLEGLIVCEVEFKTEEAAHKFKIPEFVTREVTGDVRFSNVWLAHATTNQIEHLMKEVKA